MPLPEIVRVKLSSEAAGSVSLTPVVAQDLPLADLLAVIMTTASEEPARVGEILKRGSVVSGATRYRWSPLAASPEELSAAVAAQPRSDPTRPFAAAACVRVVIHSGRTQVEIRRDAGLRRRLFRRACFWDAVLAIASATPPRYARYVHRDKEDRYTVRLDERASCDLQAAAALLAFSALAQPITQYRPDSVDFYVPRS
ncbi:MAG: hypothetical protein IT161_19925 [Bryobacterales bacterium]|nr:hypothetical protein [Bryobacterales bacterium]